MMQFTAGQWAVIALLFIAGWLLGLMSRSGGGKWRREYEREREAHAALRRDYNARVAAHAAASTTAVAPSADYVPPAADSHF